ncbi:deoxyribose-phosphate aldolase [Mycobacterium haemophilum]|uniref:Deoxyribose-phosphate aldolase n=1 Tax=Mycobacterium haemophilum TaxID=29311 RepID=A0A0I9UQH5_9MYCO|nr:deoxyribose-phosphate aldolase [Mycobacterium haemophilum]AKN18290.1 2-deoxyribose-5-phosphate aldolase [Mycobacterium haemophilum DSM 44634]KLO33116.1 deoxyribose-phosphate aldolase [Mycobacterium haemophilum]KLO38071.1 deoxyribose-phosphate aldolase [Mycobacterium haemophilum]KLO44393.1 deoxyribose-phosphate aldolase [Mycobacterium haemophilum]KLO55298.1 deoxyribose-phosphate aldolase [Mycobacterium haemophilum]
MPGQPTREQLAALVDHTLLKPEATHADVAALVAEAVELGVYAVCVSPSMVPIAVQAVGAAGAGGLRVATVAGFPSGKHVSTVKAHEAAQAAASGATEIDMVIDVGAALAGDLDAVRSDIEAVRCAVAGAVLKVIVESAVLLCQANERALADVCHVAEAAGADFVKTSTGFHPAGGASLRAVALMTEAVGGRLGVKASGGIRTAADAIALVDAGATRLGLSSTRAVLDGLSQPQLLP